MDHSNVSRPSVAPLERAVSRLKDGLDEFAADTGNGLVRDGLVLRFKHAYDLSCSTMQRYLESDAESDSIKLMEFPDLVRTACDYGLLLGDWPAWHGYGNVRDKTGHAYHDEVAEEVVAAVPAFLEEAEFLRDRIRENLP